jgi:hypothetical protein
MKITPCSRHKVYDEASSHKFFKRGRFGRWSALSFPYASRERFETCVKSTLCAFAVRVMFALEAWDAKAPETDGRLMGWV